MNGTGMALMIDEQSALYTGLPSVVTFDKEVTFCVLFVYLSVGWFMFKIDLTH